MSTINKISYNLLAPDLIAILDAKANSSDTYTKDVLDARFEAIIGTAPTSLDTLQELAAALNNQSDFATQIVTSLGTKVDKVTGKTLSTNDYTNDEKTKLAGIETSANNYTHPATHSLSIITETETLKIMTADERTKLSDIAAGATNYTHPTSHAASMIDQDSTHRFITDTERTGFHAHSNKSIIDKVTESIAHESYDLHLIEDHETRLSAIEGGYSEGHTHNNLVVLNKLLYSGELTNIDLKQIETNTTAIVGLQTSKADASTLTGHTGNSIVHVTQDNKNNWDAKLGVPTFNTETINADKTIVVGTDKEIQLITSTGISKSIILSTTNATAGAKFTIRNVGTTNAILIKQGTTVLYYLPPYNAITVHYDGTNWQITGMSTIRFCGTLYGPTLTNGMYSSLGATLLTNDDWEDADGTLASLRIKVATATKAELGVSGSNANINLNLVSKGTGTIQANGIDVALVTDTNKTKYRSYMNF